MVYVLVFGRQIQEGTPSNKSSSLPTKDIKLIQSIIDTLFYYTIEVDPSIYPALNEISIAQSPTTEFTLTKVN